MDNDERAKQFKEFIEDFEKNLDSKIREKGVSMLTWVHDSDLNFSDATTRGNCATQADCGGNRCKSKVDSCTVRYCHRLHNCASNCQVANDCKVNYCHGKAQ